MIVNITKMETLDKYKIECNIGGCITRLFVNSFTMRKGVTHSKYTIFLNTKDGTIGTMEATEVTAPFDLTPYTLLYGLTNKGCAIHG